ncbi:MAG: two-component sensor histidine kinase [Actinoallomurus sp.]|nr:two-component sensor histidine kinase [Actinoallomurus sp.]
MMSLRHRALAAMVAVATLSIVLFAIPLGLAVRRLYRAEATTALGAGATQIAAQVPESIVGHPRPLRLSSGLPNHITAGVYTTGGIRLAGAGPDRSPTTRRATDGRLHPAVEAGDLVVVAPVPGDPAIAAVVRTAIPYHRVTERVWRTWLLMAALILGVLAVAAALARHQSARLAAPLERLTEAAQALGNGDFTIRTERFGLREADQVGHTLEATARRLGRTLDAERAFASHVSHQLRTALAGLLLGIESALAHPDTDPHAALLIAQTRGEHLNTVLEDLLRLARESDHVHEPVDLTAILDDADRRWRPRLEGAGRALRLRLEDELPCPRVSAPALRQVLDVLIDNALIHGDGPITVAASGVDTGIAIDVTDQGAGISDGDGIFDQRRNPDSRHGIGLSLARTLTESQSGRLLLRRANPPTFRVLLPAAAPDDRPAGSSTHR